MGDAILLFHERGAFLLFCTTKMASCQLWPVNSLFILFFRKISGINRKCNRELIKQTPWPGYSPSQHLSKKSLSFSAA